MTEECYDIITGEPTGETTETWEIVKVVSGNAQKFSISNSYKNSDDWKTNNTIIFFDKLKYTSVTTKSELILFLKDMVVARIDMEGKEVVLRDDVNLLDLIKVEE